MDNKLPVTEDTLLSLGILTKDAIRHYPLSATNLNVVLKIYATNTYQPYAFDCKGLYHKFTEYYLTDYGLQYVYDFFKSKTFDYAYNMFHILFMRASEEDYKHLETYSFFNNFRGTSGFKRIPGTKQAALIIRKVNKTERAYEFDSIKEAREQLKTWLTLYPIEQFTLYRVRTNKQYCTKFKEKIPLVIVKKLNFRQEGKTV